MAEINNIFDLMGTPAPSPAEIAGESSFKNVLKNKDGIDLLEEEIKAARASTEETTPAPSEMVEKSDDVPTATAEPSTNTVPTEDKASEPTSETVPTPELTIEEATEEAITDDAVLASNEAKTGKGKAPLKAPTYEELKASEAYMPIVNIDRLNDSQLARAAQNKLARSMNVTTFLYCWLFFAFRDDPALCKQFLIKSKDLDKAVQYITKQIGKGAKQGSVGISEGGVIELLLKYLKLDDAKIAAEEAKKEAERKAKAEAARAKAKEKKSKKKTESKPAAPSKANTDDKAKADDKAAKKKPSTKKKSTAPKAATDDSVMSLFNMF